MLYICVFSMHWDWSLWQEGSVSVTVIRRLMWIGSRENRVYLLSDTFMNKHDISSEHVSVSYHRDLLLQSAHQWHSPNQFTHIQASELDNDMTQHVSFRFIFFFPPFSYNDGIWIVLSHISYHRNHCIEESFIAIYHKKDFQKTFSAVTCVPSDRING